MQDKQRLLIDILIGGQQTAQEVMFANTRGRGITRRAFIVAQSYGRAFTSGKINDPWLLIPGLRGTGKTTLLTQLYNDDMFRNCTKLFISFDRVNMINATIQDFVAACEKFIGCSFEEYNKPIVMFLDEVQYVDKWAIGLKTIRDRTKKIFIVCTGSSALSLQTNPDVVRRADTIKLHPMCFTEYAMIKQVHEGRHRIIKPVKSLADSLRTALFASSDAEACYIALSKLSPQVKSYWKTLCEIAPRQQLFGEYVTLGTLPFTLSLPNNAAVWRRINHILSESLDRDVTMFGKFDSNTINSINRLLFVLASSIEISMNKISSSLSMDIRTVAAVLSALEKTEIINAIPPKGAHNGNVKKASKYLFTSPAMRAALCNYGGIITPENSDSLRGKLLEDTVGLYLKRLFFDTPITPAIVEYDTASGGADFILSPDGKKDTSIAIEVGANKTVGRQAIKTLENTGGRYGLIITAGELDVDGQNRIVRVPFEYFLLV
jgi:predicted AAA+ superfamily ATPase